MNAWLNLADGGWWHVAGWTMLHFVWLGTLVALAAGACRLVLRRASANVRYAAALAWLVVLAALPIGIATWEAAKPQAMGTTESLVDAPPMQTTPTAPGSAGGLTRAVDMEKLAAIAPIVSNEQAIAPNTAANPRPSRGLTDVLARVAEYLPWAWLTGTPLTFVLLVTGVVGAERLRRSSRIISDGPIADACAQLMDSLRIGRQVTVAICDRIAAPVLVGIVRPMILLPSSALTGWSPDEIEMVLLHELAHVRRWDNFVNLVQRFVEAALFFHPAVWLVSRWVRAEREACCDSVVVGRTNRPHDYAEMLVALAAQLPRSVLFHPAATSAMAAGPLRSRIHRILSLDDDPMLISGKSLGIVMSGLLLIATLVVLNLPTSTRAEEEQASRSIAVDDPVLVDVPIEAGATKFENGDEIKITEVRGTSNSFRPGNEYWIKGTYTLRSRDRATLGAHVTAQTSDRAITRNDPEQSIKIERGSGEFTLKLPMHGNGWPHVSFYPKYGGQSFGGVYFGTGDSVLKKWWESKDVKYNDSKIETEAVRQELKRQVDVINQLRLLAIALLNYQDAKGSLPANASYDTFDRPLLSWRVHILPYLDDEAAVLYKEFRLDEPWDSEHNRALIPRMPAVFKNPNRPGTGFTDYLAVVGEDCIFDGTAKGTKLAQIPDGTANTVMLVEADDGVEWTRPADLKFNRARPKAGLGGRRPNGWFAVFADGSVRLIDKKETLKNIRDLFTRGEQQLDTHIRMPNPDRTVSVSDNELRSMFVPTDDNPLETKTYRITNAPNAVLRLEWMTTMLAKNASGPKVVFGYNWKDGWETLEIVAPKRGQEFLEPQILATQTTSKSPASRAKFPSLEDQKLIDQIWKKLGVELEPIDEIDLGRAKALGYEGGLEVSMPLGTGGGGTWPNLLPQGGSGGGGAMGAFPLYHGDILIGLHVWPTTKLEDVIAVLNRDDVRELSPLKFYVVRRIFGPENVPGEQNASDQVVSGRIDVKLDRERRQAAPDLFALVPQPTPRVVAATPMPIPLGSMKSSATDATTDEQVDQALAEDPKMAMMNQELMSLQYQLSALAGVTSSKDGDRLKALIAAKQRAIQAYRRQYQGQPAAAASSEPVLRYDGKTFDEWQEIWTTTSPIGTDRRLEALRVLATFGAAGYGREAAAAIIYGAFSDSEPVARHSRKYLSTLSLQDARPIVTNLVEVLNTELSTMRRIAALRALAAIGPNSEGALAVLESKLASNEPRERIAVAAAIKMIVGKDQYQKPIAEVLGKELGITVVETDGVWAALPREDATDDGKAFSDFTNAVIKEQQQLFPDGKF